MQTVKSVSWVRMILAFGAILLVAGSGLSLAAGPAGLLAHVLDHHRAQHDPRQRDE